MCVWTIKANIYDLVFSFNGILSLQSRTFASASCAPSKLEDILLDFFTFIPHFFAYTLRKWDLLNNIFI